MPTISMFYGLIIRMFANDHNPPHFHVYYGGDRAQVDFDGNIINGRLPNSKLKLVSAWCEIHKEDLIANWELCRSGHEPFIIRPLE